ncbi:transketolase-like [Saccoglossus kowalevskii]|uniref:Transketolase n=1 Tax=Saccoglossus kowalevskii TaxID=10224 RepID=A0ABM0GN32_SACKO|nr:PREDICTED: transketolase-like [Saccoglossus kowalevskii]
MAEYHRPDSKKIQNLRDVANRLRIHSISATNASNSGHPTSCCSAAEIMSVLFFHQMKYKVKEPKDAANDRFVMSKGHAAPILYAAWAEAGLFPKEDLLNLRKIDSDLEGHPTPRLNFIDVATGSLGQGLSIACGMAYIGKYIDKARTKLRLFTPRLLFKRLYGILLFASNEGIEDQMNWHGKPLGDKAEGAIEAIHKLIVTKNGHGLCPQLPSSEVPAVDLKVKLSEPPSYTKGQKVATRLAYGTALAKIGTDNVRVVAMDGDTKNSTFADKFKNAHPDRFVECFIAEQNLVGVAIGAACRDRTVAFASTFAAFFSRAYDLLRMGAISQTNANFCGSHCGVSIGEDGPSQMALEDLAMFRAIPGSTVFYPSDAVSTERAVELAANTTGICFIRSSRPPTAVLYDNNEVFQPGKAKVVRQSDKDSVTIIGAGVTLYEAIAAADKLSADGINVRIIDPFTIKPLDVETIATNARKTGGKILTVEDHYPEGGIGEAVAGAMSEFPNITIRRLAVNAVPRSGKSTELLDMFGISSSAIVKTIKEMVK